MSSSLSRGFRAQVTSTMDMAIRRAVFEIMNIFENTVHDYQMELVQKGEEVAQLKIKLQTAELKLKDHCDKRQEVTLTQCQTQAQPEAGTLASSQTLVACQVDNEATKPSVSVCPSVRLRQLSIPLWHIPILKHEVVNCAIDSYLETRNHKTSRGTSTAKDGPKPTVIPDQRFWVPDQNAEHQIMRKGRKTLQRNIKRESFDPGYCQSLRRSRRNQTVQLEARNVKSKRKKRVIAANSQSAEQETEKKNGDNTFPCNICSKVFNSKFGHSVHARSHRKCRGCKKVFESRRDLKAHKLSCRKLRQCSATKATRHSEPSTDKGKRAAPSKKNRVNKKDSKLSTGEKSKDCFCPRCHKQYTSPYWLAQHMHVHTGKKYLCSLCPRKFYFESGLKTHMGTIHKYSMDLSTLNGDLEWTRPLEEIEDCKEDFISASANSNGKGKYS